MKEKTETEKMKEKTETEKMRERGAVRREMKGNSETTERGRSIELTEKSGRIETEERRKSGIGVAKKRVGTTKGGGGKTTMARMTMALTTIGEGGMIGDAIDLVRYSLDRMSNVVEGTNIYPRERERERERERA